MPCHPRCSEGVEKLGLAGVVVIAAVLAPAAFAGKPTMERVDVDETFVDGLLSAECGVEVTTHIRGHIIFRTFAGGGNVSLTRSISR